MNFEFIRRWLLLGSLIVLSVSVSGQKAEFFDNLTFDSTYSIVGVARGFGKYPDSLERFWFLLTDPAAMQTLQKDWVFSKPAHPTTYNQIIFDVYVIKDKRLAARTGLIYPSERMATPGNGRWYAFDTSKLVALHAAHPVHYHTEQKFFQSYTEYAVYDQYVPIGRTKDPWEPAPIDIAIFRRDTPDPSKGN